MKRRSKIWLIFLVLGVICTIITKCKDAKAEGYDPWSGDPWQPPAWLTSEDPFNTPAPLETPSPSAAPSDGQKGASGEGVRGVPNDGQYGTVRYKAGWWSRLLNGNQATVYWRDVWGGTTVFNPNSLNPWLLFINDGTAITNQVFENSKSYTNTNGVYTGITSAENCGIDFSVTYNPQSQEVLNNEMQFKFSCRWNINVSLEANVNAAYTFEDLNINYSDFQNYIPVTVFYVFRYNDNGTDKYEWVRDDIYLSDLESYSYTFDSSDIPDDLYIKSVTVHIVVNYDCTRNYIYNLVKDWYYNYDSTITNVPYPTIRYNAKNVINAKLKITYTENAKNRSWLLRLIQSIFLPDPDAMADIFNSYLGDPSVGGSGVVIGMREILYNHLIDNEPQEAIINLPEINIPMGNNTIHIFDGYSFNLTEFYNGNSVQSGPFRTLARSVQFMTSTLIFSAFFQSIWALVSKIFGLHLWQGVNGEDVAESDEGDD